MPFEKNFSDLVTSLIFRYAKDSVQHELQENIRKIKTSPNVTHLRKVKRPSPEISA